MSTFLIEVRDRRLNNLVNGAQQMSDAIVFKSMPTRLLFVLISW